LLRSGVSYVASSTSFGERGGPVEVRGESSLGLLGGNALGV
jgi:hypothetical protein